MVRMGSACWGEGWAVAAESRRILPNLAGFGECKEGEREVQGIGDAEPVFVPSCRISPIFAASCPELPDFAGSRRVLTGLPGSYASKAPGGALIACRAGRERTCLSTQRPLNGPALP